MIHRRISEHSINQDKIAGSEASSGAAATASAGVTRRASRSSSSAAASSTAPNFHLSIELLVDAVIGNVTEASEAITDLRRELHGSTAIAKDATISRSKRKAFSVAFYIRRIQSGLKGEHADYLKSLIADKGGDINQAAVFAFQKHKKALQPLNKKVKANARSRYRAFMDFHDLSGTEQQVWQSERGTPGLEKGDKELNAIAHDLGWEGFKSVPDVRWLTTSDGDTTGGTLS